MAISDFLRDFDIKDEKDLFKYLDENRFQWGMIINGKKETNLDSKTYSKLWTLKEPEKVIEDKIAICWDYANFEKSIFEQLGLKSSIYYLIFDNDIENNPSHCFTVIDREDSVVLFEYSFRQKAKIYTDKNLENIINMILSWCYEKFEYLKSKDAIVYKFADAFSENINAKELFNLAKKQQVVFDKSCNSK